MHGLKAGNKWAPHVTTSAFANAPFDHGSRERHACKDSINPWAEEESTHTDGRSSGEGAPRSAKRGRSNGHGGLMRGVQRGGSAAMDVIRACSFNTSLGAHSPPCLHASCFP